MLLKILKTLQPYALLRPRELTAALKLSMVLERAALLGMLFQIFTADGKKELVAADTCGWLDEFEGRADS